MKDKLTRGEFYPLADGHPLNRSLPSLGWSSNDVMAQWDGQPKRPPRKGEWYLSGSLIEAYKAPNDLKAAFHIAKLFKVTRKQVTVITPLEEVE